MAFCSVIFLGTAVAKRNDSEIRWENQISSLYCLTEIISFVQNGDVDGSPFRPKIPDLHDKDLNKIANVIRVGWSQRPSERPTAQQMLRDIQKINPFK